MDCLTDIDREIIVALAANSMNVSETARKLLMPRHAVVSHICNINKMTGLDPNNFYDLYDLIHKVKKGKAPTNLCGKCGGCAYGEIALKVFGKSKCFVRCRQPEQELRRTKNGTSHYRKRTEKACKKYKPKEGV